MLKGKNILLGVSGSIASYKACDIVRYFQKKGANVRVIMTPSAKEFVGQLTFQALTNYPVLSDWKDGETGLEHITLARWADVFLIAPASANTIAKIRIGLTDNFLTSLALAYDKPIIIAPAMNTKMYENPATFENIKVLKERGHLFVQPEEGQLACGEEGIGKLAGLDAIESMVLYSIYPKPLKGKKVLITAGGTREFFDPIRYISNASSGKMGYSFAKASFILGADEVLLISAPTCLEKPYGVKKIDVISAEDMYNAVIENFENYDVIIMNAAVADFKPAEYSNKKLKKTEGKAVVKLKQNPDILKELGGKKRKGQILIGFAAESENLEENAKEKLKRKNLDVIIVNKLNVFSKENHEGKIIFKNNEIINIPPMTKEESAIFILEKIFNKLM